MTIEMNKDAVLKLKEVVNAVTDVSNLEEKEILELATLDMFDKVKAPLLTVFYKCRVLQDLKLKLPIPATVKKYRIKLLIRKPGGPF